jgi:hypothetical protein
MQNGMLLKVEEKLSFCVLQKKFARGKVSPIKVKRPVHYIVKKIFVTEME